MPDRKDQSSDLLSLVQHSGTTSVSCVGLAKNVGKTVAFNHLVEQAADRSLRLGLTSIGRDGEKRDEVFHTPKPRIFAPTGSLLATATDTLKRCEAKVEVLQHTGFASAMGEILLVRTTAAGLVELAGPTLISQHQALQKIFIQHGAELTLIDGALDRVSPAVPGLAQAIILSTGAALGQSIDLVLSKTLDRINRLTLPQVSDALLVVCPQITAANQVALLEKALQPHILPAAHSLLAGELLKQTITNRTEAVVLSGAVGDSILDCLLASQRCGKLQLVLKNGAALFCSPELWRRFVAAGGSIRVVEPIHLLAVTVNPISPIGAPFDAYEFFSRLATGLTPYPVFDLVQCFSMRGRK
jgi:hypothetical protein